MSKLDRIKRLWTAAGNAARSLGGDIKSRVLATISRVAMVRHSDTVPKSNPLPTERTPMQAIMERRANLEAQTEACAKCAHVPDGLSLSLLANFKDGLAERKRLLTEREHELAGGLRRLSALCPLPPAPEPQPLPEPRPRKFTRVSDWFSGGQAGLAK